MRLREAVAERRAHAAEAARRHARNAKTQTTTKLGSAADAPSSADADIESRERRQIPLTRPPT
jgi:hypothetical protein